MARRAADETPEMMTVEQVAAYLQLHRMTVYQYIKDGRIAASRIGKSYRVRRRDLDAFLDATRLGAPRRRLTVVAPERVQPGRPRARPDQAVTDLLSSDLAQSVLRALR